MTGTRYETRDAFRADLQEASPGITEEQSAVFERFASQLRPSSAGSRPGWRRAVRPGATCCSSSRSAEGSTSWPATLNVVVARSGGAGWTGEGAEGDPAVITAAKEAVARSDSSPYAK